MKTFNKYLKFFVALSLFFFGSLLKWIPILVFKLNTENMSQFTSIALTAFSNLASFIILVLMYRKSIITGIKALNKDKFKVLSTGFNYWFIGLMVMVISNTIITYFNNGGTSNNEESIRFLINSYPLLAIFLVAIISPCIEELVFRKSFRDIFNNKWMYICTSGLIFGALHILTGPVNSLIDYLYLIPYCSMGIAFSYMYYKTDNIAVPIAMHILHNTLNTIFTIMAGAIIW